MEFTDRGVQKLLRDQDEARRRGEVIPAQKLFFEKQGPARGRTLVLLVSKTRTLAWRAQGYVDGKPQSRSLGFYAPGTPDHMSIAKARQACRAFTPATKPEASEVQTFKSVAEEWLVRYVDVKALRSAKEIRRQLNKYVYPQWADKDIFAIGRREVTALLDHIADHHGRSMADAVFSYVKVLMRWFASRDNRYTPPIVPGMKRDHRSAREKARKRILSESEIKALWELTADNVRYHGLIRLLLLTGQRAAKVAKMRRDDLRPSKDGVIWHIRTESREKGNGGTLLLPPLAAKIIHAQPVIDGDPRVFPFRSLWDGKKKLDAKMQEVLPGIAAFTQHDLRRTARSLMAKAGVSDRVAEQVLGHVIAGIEGIYNRHGYEAEKAEALRKLEDLVRTIVGEPPRAQEFAMTYPDGIVSDVEMFDGEFTAEEIAEVLARRRAKLAAGE